MVIALILGYIAVTILFGVLKIVYLSKNIIAYNDAKSSIESTQNMSNNIYSLSSELNSQSLDILKETDSTIDTLNNYKSTMSDTNNSIQSVITHTYTLNANIDNIISTNLISAKDEIVSNLDQTRDLILDHISKVNTDIITKINDSNN